MVARGELEIDIYPNRGQARHVGAVAVADDRPRTDGKVDVPAAVAGAPEDCGEVVAIRGQEATARPFVPLQGPQLNEVFGRTAGDRAAKLRGCDAPTRTGSGGFVIRFA